LAIVPQPSPRTASPRTQLWNMTLASLRHGRPSRTLPFILLPRDVTVQRSKTNQPGSSARSRELAVMAPLAVEASVDCANQAEAAPKM
jgi:hypothetical protein